MSSPCQELRAQFVAHHQGELAPLQAQRLTLHLANCAACRATHGVLTGGLKALRDEPEPEAADVEALIAELAASPLLALPAIPQHKSPPRRFAVLAAWAPALAAGVAAVVVGARLLLPAPATAPQMTAPTAQLDDHAPPVLNEGPPPPPPTPTPVDLGTEEQPTRHVRVVRSAGFTGTVKADGSNTYLTVEQGALAVAFQGGQGRRLQIEAGPVSINVTGTRFFVDRRADGVRVGVKSGTVEARTAAGTWRLSAGEDIELGLDGEERTGAGASPAAAWLERTFLVQGEALVVVPSPAPRPTRSNSGDAGDAGDVDEAPPAEPPAAPTPKGTGALMALFGEAEGLVAAGDREGARRLYEAAVGDDGFAAQRTLARYELARFLALVENDAAAALPRLRDLSREPGSVGDEASLLVCQLHEPSNPCEAARCLESAKETRPAVRLDAERLANRWHLTARCTGEQ
jgi:hypothetical protein